jgi:phosphoglycolate phosphatase
MKEYRAYLFDFDGTLFNTLDSLVGVYQTGFREIGMDCTKKDVSVYMHMSLTQTLDKLGVVDELLRKTFIAKIAEALDYPEYVAKIQLYEDVIPTISALANRGKIIGICSGNTSKHIELVLQQFGLQTKFAFFIGNSPDRLPKPAPDVINYAKTLMPGVGDNQMVYIGDSLQDPLTAEHAKIDGILLERDLEYPKYPDVKISSLRDLLR